MKVLVQSTHTEDVAAIVAECRAIEPSWTFVAWPSDEACEYGILWRPPSELFVRQPALRAIVHFGAGVDAVLASNAVPAAVAIVRLEDAGMAQPMAEYAMFAVLQHQREMDVYREQQKARVWRSHASSSPMRPTVGVMGLGQLGRVVAEKLAQFGYPVRGWSRTKKELANIRAFAGDEELTSFLSDTDVLVSILPLTEATRGILDRRSFSLLPRGAYVVNMGRGAHVVDEDLLAAIDSGHLSGAMLDVFASEPLPATHAFWSHPKIMITPHIAAKTPTREACVQAIAKLRALSRGEHVSGVVDPSRGY
jgi:glyoxylate/hydroxypyruvate reductase A